MTNDGFTSSNQHMLAAAKYCDSDKMWRMRKEPNHHYIPIFYLQNWTAPKSHQLIEYCRRYKGVVARPTFPAGTGYVPGLNKLPDAKPGEEYVIETKLMSSIDSRAARALQCMLVDGEPPGKLDTPEALGWCQFLYSLIVRNPEHLDRIKEKLATLDSGEILERVRVNYPNTRGPGDPEHFDDFKAAFIKNPIEVPAIRVLPELVRSKRVVRMLTSFKWHTAAVNAVKYPLLTSDRPVIMSNGLIHQDAHIVLPISPRRLFIATKNEETFQYFREMNPDELACAVNNQVCQQAYKFVFGIDDSQLRFVSNRLGKRVWSSPLG